MSDFVSVVVILLGFVFVVVAITGQQDQIAGVFGLQLPGIETATFHGPTVPDHTGQTNPFPFPTITGNPSTPTGRPPFKTV